MIYAGFWRRLLAYLIDALVLSLMQIGLYATALLSFSSLGKAMGAAAAATSAATWAYFAVMESSPLQATLGKLVMGLQVEHVRGGPLTFRRASVRHWAKVLSTLALMFGWLMAGFTPRRQALHDVIAGSVVVRRDRLVAAAGRHWDPAVPLLAEYWDGTRWVQQ